MSETTRTGRCRQRGPWPGRAWFPAALALAVAIGCGEVETPRADTGPDAARAAPRDTAIRIFFSRNDTVAPVVRVIDADSVSLAASLELLLRGPTADERASGLTSWFSQATAGALRAVEVSEEGAAVVDFEDLRPLIPNASSSAGSAMLLRELNATVFENPAVSSVEYRMEGSCAAFHEWLQYGCRTVSRP